MIFVKNLPTVLDISCFRNGIQTLFKCADMTVYLNETNFSVLVFVMINFSHGFIFTNANLDIFRIDLFSRIGKL